MNKFRFLEWQVYKDAKELFAEIREVVSRLPKEYRFELGSQMIRSALSVVLNIAEGSAKGSDRELNRYMDIALGSLTETLAAADLAKENGLITQRKFDELYKRVDSISKQMGGFKKQLRRQS